MLLAVTVQKTFDALAAEIETQAIDQGEANKLIALKNVIATVQKEATEDGGQ